MKASAVSHLTTHRLSVYLRCLNHLEEAGVKTVSSRELADQFHLNSAQIRKDLANFGEFGTRGVGYDVPALKLDLIRILGLNKDYNIIIVGAGNLGAALAAYRGFNVREFRIAALFDIDADRVKALAAAGFKSYSMSDLKKVVRKEKIDIAVLAVPAASGQVVLGQVVEAGVRAILNFVPVTLRVPPGVELVTVDLKIQMEGLAYHLTHCGPRDARADKPARASAGKSAGASRAGR